MLLLVEGVAFGQGTFQFDQQSSTDETPYSFGTPLNGLMPTGQSFTPAFSTMNFVRLKFADGATGDAAGASVYLNLRSQSLAGPILGTTPTVEMPDGFNGTENFFFPNTIPVVPGTQYYIELVVTFAINWRVDIEQFNYPGGQAYENGSPLPGGDYWFREGIYTVPEPGPVLLVTLGAAAFLLFKRAPIREANSS